MPIIKIIGADKVEFNDNDITTFEDAICDSLVKLCGGVKEKIIVQPFISNPEKRDWQSGNESSFLLHSHLNMGVGHPALASFQSLRATA